jgi:hypothetical protein
MEEFDEALGRNMGKLGSSRRMLSCKATFMHKTLQIPLQQMSSPENQHTSPLSFQTSARAFDWSHC